LVIDFISPDWIWVLKSIAHLKWNVRKYIEEHRQEPVHQEQEDPRIEKALNVKNVMQTIMRMNKEDLKKTLAEKKDTMNIKLYNIFINIFKIWAHMLQVTINK
jgi:hypothetical protein